MPTMHCILYFTLHTQAQKYAHLHKHQFRKFSGGSDPRPRVGRGTALSQTYLIQLDTYQVSPTLGHCHLSKQTAAPAKHYLSFDQNSHLNVY